MSKTTITIEDVDNGVSISLEIQPELKEGDAISNSVQLGAAAYQYIEHILNKAVEPEGGSDVSGNC